MADKPGQAGGDEDAGYELSPSGNPILRHKDRSIPFQFATGDSENIERISAHIEKHLGEVAGVYHEIVSDLVHIDVHVVRPTAERNFFTLVTSGMSEAPMTVPEGAEEFRYAELMVQLPPDWPLDELEQLAGKQGPGADAERTAAERWYWPIRWLKQMARLPHEYDTWLGEAHTVPNGDPPEPFADDTKLCGMLVFPALNVPDDFRTLAAGPEKRIHFYQLIPLYAEEMDLKLRKGVGALVDLFDKHGLDPVINPRRPNVAAGRKKWFGII